MDLSFIPPTNINGMKVVEISIKDIAKENVKQKSVIVVCVVGTGPSIGAMERFILVHEGFTTKPVVLYHIDSCFVVKFEKLMMQFYDLDHIIYSRDQSLLSFGQ